MGEIADMILDGTICEECCGLIVEVNCKEELDNVPIDELSPGYPRLCKGCKEEKEFEEKCPMCGGLLANGYNWSGVRCSNPECNYWFCY